MTLPNRIPESATTRLIPLRPEWDVDQVSPQPLANPPAATLVAYAVRQEVASEYSWPAMVRDIDFAGLTDLLNEYEKNAGYSTVEMFRRYLQGEYVDDPSIEDWISAYVMYLGTDEIRRFSAP